MSEDEKALQEYREQMLLAKILGELQDLAESERHYMRVFVTIAEDLCQLLGLKYLPQGMDTTMPLDPAYHTCIEPHINAFTDSEGYRDALRAQLLCKIAESIKNDAYSRISKNYVPDEPA